MAEMGREPGRKNAVELPSGDPAKDRRDEDEDEDGTLGGARDGGRTQVRIREPGSRVSLPGLALRTAFHLGLRHHG